LKLGVRLWTDSTGSGCPVAGSCEHGNEHLSSKKGGEFLDPLRDYQLLKDSAPCPPVAQLVAPSFIMPPRTFNSEQVTGNITNCLICYCISRYFTLCLLIEPL
jgi:hypothetical protein